MDRRLVVNFHGIGDPHPWVDADERRVWCSKARFVSLLDAMPQVSAEMGMPIQITFDDGNLSDLVVAAPALLRRGLTATFFICAGRIGKPGYLDAAQMRQLAAAGMAIGSHGWSHLDWRRVRLPQALFHEIDQARETIADQLDGQTVDAVAIPFGSYDRRVMKAALGAFSVVYTSDGGTAAKPSAIVPRESYTVQWDADTLRRLAAPGSRISMLRRALAKAYKRYRGSPSA